MQNHYNPVYREEEREMLPLCEQEDIGVVPWSPLARGYLTRPHDEFDTTARGSEEEESREDNHAIYRSGGGEEINRRIEEFVNEYDVTMAQLTIAWHLHTGRVTAPIIGVSSILENLADTRGERLVFVHEDSVTSAMIRSAPVRWDLRIETYGTEDELVTALRRFVGGIMHRERRRVLSRLN